MLKRLKNEKAQMTFLEYVILFAVVATVIVSMTVYFRRAVQGRIFDARDYAVYHARDLAGPHYNGNYYFFYEPYYLRVNSVTKQNSLDRWEYYAGTDRRTYNQWVSTESFSNTLPPEYFNLNIPKYSRP